jgi:hypothetical protein
MLIGAALLEFRVPDARSIKARRSVANSLKDRIKKRFGISAAEVGDPDEWHEVFIGCVEVGTDPRVMRERMERVVRFVEKLGLAELVSDDVTVAQLDELSLAEGAEIEDFTLPEAWKRR